MVYLPVIFVREDKLFVSILRQRGRKEKEETDHYYFSEENRVMKKTFLFLMGVGVFLTIVSPSFAAFTAAWIVE